MKLNWKYIIIGFIVILVLFMIINAVSNANAVMSDRVLPTNAYARNNPLSTIERLESFQQAEEEELRRRSRYRPRARGYDEAITSFDESYA